MAESLTSVSQRRGASLVLVSCAYTSQIDSRYGVLLGTRKGDWFHCFDGVVLDADENAARNILARSYDVGIPLFMPYQQIKSVLLERAISKTDGTAHPRHELQDGSTVSSVLSTVSELLFN